MLDMLYRIAGWVILTLKEMKEPEACKLPGSDIVGDEMCVT